VTLSFRLGAAAPVEAAVYDARGRRLADRQLGEFAPGITHAWTWDGRDAAGRRAATGVYWVRLKIPGDQETRRVLLLR
jgi:flagellar hook assembly protein FlgD